MLIGGLGFLIFPWYVTGDGFFSINWIKEYSLEDYGSVIPQVFLNKKYWLLPLIFPLFFPLATLKLSQNNPLYSKIFLYSGLFGFLGFVWFGFPRAQRPTTLESVNKPTGRNAQSAKPTTGLH